MRKLFALTAFLAAPFAYADSSLDYSAMRQAILAGHQVRIVADLSKCVTIEKTGKAISSGIDAFTPNEMMLRENGQIDAALLHFIFSQHYPNGAVYQYVHYSSSPDNHMQIDVKLLDARTYAPLGYSAKFDCKLKEAAFVYKVN